MALGKMDLVNATGDGCLQAREGGHFRPIVLGDELASIHGELV